MRSTGFMVSLGATLALGVPQRCPRDLKSCDKNPAVTVLSLLRATRFCSEFLDIKTHTVSTVSTIYQTVPYTVVVTTTETAPQTASSITTLVQTATSTVTLPGPTVVKTAIETVRVTSQIFNTQLTTVTSGVTDVTTYSRVGTPAKREVALDGGADPVLQDRGDIPQGLKNFGLAVISTACNCYVTRPTVTATAFVTDQITATETKNVATTVSPVVTTVVNVISTTEIVLQTVTGPDTLSTITEQITATSVVTTTIVQTSIVPSVRPVQGPTYTFVRRYTNKCTPFNYLGSFLRRLSATTYEGAFQQCAAQCQAAPTCAQIWLSYDTTNFVCTIGEGGPSTFGWNDSEIQCNYPPIGQYGDWYDKVRQ